MKLEYLLLGTGLIVVLVYMKQEPSVRVYHESDIDSNKNVQTEKQPAESGIEMDQKNSGASESSVISNVSKIAVPVALVGGTTLYVYSQQGKPAFWKFDAN